MAAGIINQKQALELLKSGNAMSDYQVRFDEEKIEALDAFLLRKNGIAVPDELVYYDEASIDFDDDAEISDQDIEAGRLVRILRAEIAIDKEIAD